MVEVVELGCGQSGAASFAVSRLLAVKGFVPHIFLAGRCVWFGLGRLVSGTTMPQMHCAFSEAVASTTARNEP